MLLLKKIVVIYIILNRQKITKPRSFKYKSLLLILQLSLVKSRESLNLLSTTLSC